MLGLLLLLRLRFTVADTVNVSVSVIVSDDVSAIVLMCVLWSFCLY